MALLVWSIQPTYENHILTQPMPILQLFVGGSTIPLSDSIPLSVGDKFKFRTPSFWIPQGNNSPIALRLGGHLPPPSNILAFPNPCECAHNLALWRPNCAQWQSSNRPEGFPEAHWSQSQACSEHSSHPLDIHVWWVWGNKCRKLWSLRVFTTILGGSRGFWLSHHALDVNVHF